MAALSLNPKSLLCRRWVQKIDRRPIDRRLKWNGWCICWSSSGSIKAGIVRNLVIIIKQWTRMWGSYFGIFAWIWPRVSEKTPPKNKTKAKNIYIRSPASQNGRNRANLLEFDWIDLGVLLSLTRTLPPPNFTYARTTFPPPEPPLIRRKCPETERNTKWTSCSASALLM